MSASALSSALANLQGRREGKAYSTPTIVLWSIAGFLLLVGLFKLLVLLLDASVQVDAAYLAGSVFGIIIRSLLFFALGAAYRNPHAFFDGRADGFWLYNRSTRKVSPEPVWIAWQDITKAKKGFLSGVVVHLHNGHKFSTGYFPNVSSNLRAVASQYSR